MFYNLLRVTFILFFVFLLITVGRESHFVVAAGYENFD